jgi:hypothetical protein
MCINLILCSSFQGVFAFTLVGLNIEIMPPPFPSPQLAANGLELNDFTSCDSICL